MKYALVVAFGAVALAQPTYNNGTTGCIDVVVETVWETFTTCPCSTTSGLATTTSVASSAVSSAVSSATSSASTTIDVGTDSDTGPILTGSSSSTISLTATTTGSASSDATLSTIAPPISASTSGAAPSSSTSSTTTTTTTTSPQVVPTPTGGSPGTVREVSLASLPQDYQYRALYAHNLHRANASIVNLIWNDTIAGYAKQLADTCVYGHSRAQGDGNYGQNIGAGFTADQIPVMITNAMYNGEINFYPGPYGSDNVDTSNFSRWGHYSQIVWTDTTAVGCATTYCPNGLANTGGGVPPYFTVCNYYTPGNYVGSWSRVGTPRGGGTVTFVA